MSPRSNSAEDWVTVATFTWLQEAQILKGLFESENIETFIPEEHMSTINPMATGMQVRVQVKAFRVEMAKRMIAEFQPLSVKQVCPSCGSDECTNAPDAKGTRSRNWVKFILGLLVMVPMRRGHSRKKCGKCGTLF
jgi:hypothetical protein